MDKQIYQTLNLVSQYLAKRYAELPKRLYKIVDPGLIRSIEACEKNGMMPQKDALKELIEDAVKGDFYFLDNIKEDINNE